MLKQQLELFSLKSFRLYLGTPQPSQEVSERVEAMSAPSPEVCCVYSPEVCCVYSPEVCCVYSPEVWCVYIPSGLESTAQKRSLP